MNDLTKEVTLNEEQAIVLTINDELKINIRHNDIGYSIDVFNTADELIEELTVYDDDLIEDCVGDDYDFNTEEDNIGNNY